MVVLTPIYSLEHKHVHFIDTRCKFQILEQNQQQGTLNQPDGFVLNRIKSICRFSSANFSPKNPVRTPSPIPTTHLTK